MMRFLKGWLPPVVLEALQRARRRGTHFEGEFKSWRTAEELCEGYDTQEILEKALDAALKVKHGDATFERDSVIFHHAEYNWQVVSGLMLAAAKHKGELKVLDFGGAFGSTYFQHRALFKDLPHYSWCVVEQPRYARAAQTSLQDDNLFFCDSIETCISMHRPNAVLLSSVLQYLPDASSLIAKIKQIGPEIIIIDRTIVNTGDLDRIYIQHVPPSIYKASYPCRSLSQKRLIAEFGPAYQLVTEFQSLDFRALGRINSHFKGYLLRRNTTL